MKSFLACLFLVVSLHAVPLQPPKNLRVVISVDTYGRGIQRGSVADQQHMEDSFQALAELLHLQPKIQILKDDDCSVDSIKNAILPLKSYSEDIVVFLYSGHGNMDPYKSSWPVMYPAGGVANKGLRASSVVKFFQKNPHRLVILLFDCCNKNISCGPYDEVTKGDDFTIRSSDNLPGFKKLFLEATGLVVGSAASRREEALCHNSGKYIGSVFTNGFLFSVKKKCSKTNPSWHDVFHVAERFCHKQGDKKDPQHPILRFYKE